MAEPDLLWSMVGSGLSAEPGPSTGPRRLRASSWSMVGSGVLRGVRSVDKTAGVMESVDSGRSQATTLARVASDLEDSLPAPQT